MTWQFRPASKLRPIHEVRAITNWESVAASRNGVAKDRSLILDERVGQPDFDERLPSHPETTGLLIDLA